MLTREDTNLVSEKETLLTFAEKEMVDRGLRAVFDYASENGLPAAKDDRCASLEAALIRYVIASRDPLPTRCTCGRPYIGGHYCREALAAGSRI